MALPDALTMTMNILSASDMVDLVTHTVGAEEEISIYGEVLPSRPLLNADEINKPATALVVKSFPGTQETDGGLSKPRILVRAYARDLADARELSAIANVYLHDLTFDETDDDEDTHRIELEMMSGPNTGIEPGTLYPYCDRIYTTAVM